MACARVRRGGDCGGRGKGWRCKAARARESLKGHRVPSGWWHWPPRHIRHARRRLDHVMIQGMEKCGMRLRCNRPSKCTPVQSRRSYRGWSSWPYTTERLSHRTCTVWAVVMVSSGEGAVLSCGRTCTCVLYNHCMNVSPPRVNHSHAHRPIA